ncbi:hypothetical protein ABZ470_23625 [Streptosporangium sp. NPDC020072]|uniref:phage adaptor protein n=1 Tax=Streptosporangium sp. NPDC020072 TaxID=3154788 RepID=UPI003425CE42
MSTLASITDRIIATLQGASRDQAEQTHLVAGIADTDLTLQAFEPKLLSQGLIEIGDELLWVSAVDNGSGSVTIAPYGRGVQTSAPSAHDAGAMIVNNPRFPRALIRASVNDAISGVYPDLYARKTYEFPAVATRVSYEIPAEAEQVHRVSWQDIGPSKRWIPVSRWRFDPAASTDDFPTGKSLDLYQAPLPGRTVRVVYQRPPAPFTDSSTEFATATGLNASAEDCIVYGALFRLVGMLEAPRLQLAAIESQLRGQLVQPGATQSAVRHYMQLYQLALTAERERLLRSDPVSAHYRYI